MTDRVRHVWVRPEHSPTDCPGLILEWRRDDQSESQALVTHSEPRGGPSRSGRKPSSCDPWQGEGRPPHRRRQNRNRPTLGNHWPGVGRWRAVCRGHGAVGEHRHGARSNAVTMSPGISR